MALPTLLWVKMKEAGLTREKSEEFFHWFNGRDDMTVREASIFIDKFDGHLKKFLEQTNAQEKTPPSPSSLADGLQRREVCRVISL